MKTTGWVLAAAVLYSLWRFLVLGDAFVLPSGSASHAAVAGKVERIEAEQGFSLVIRSGPARHVVTAITLPRSAAGALGLAPPAGFVEETLQAGLDADESARAFVAAFNEETLRWVGRLPLAPDAEARIWLPSSNAKPADVRMIFQYEREARFGVKISTFDIALDAKTAQPHAATM